MHEESLRDGVAVAAVGVVGPAFAAAENQGSAGQTMEGVLVGPTCFQVSHPGSPVDDGPQQRLWVDLGTFDQRQGHTAAVLELKAAVPGATVCTLHPPVLGLWPLAPPCDDLRVPGAVS